MKPLLYLTLLASFAGGFFFGVYEKACQYDFAALFLLWSCLNMGIAFHLVNALTHKTYVDHR